MPHGKQRTFPLLVPWIAPLFVTRSPFHPLTEDRSPERGLWKVIAIAPGGRAYQEQSAQVSASRAASPRNTSEAATAAECQ